MLLKSNLVPRAFCFRGWMVREKDPGFGWSVLQPDWWFMADGHAMYSSVINTLLPDNNHLTDTNSDLAKDVSSIRTISDEITALAMKNLKLSWAGDFESLKRVVSHYIEFDGRWTSPGGEKKVCSNQDTSITWWKNKKFLLVEGYQAKRII